MHQLFGYSLSTVQLVVVGVVAFMAGFAKTGIIGLGIVITPVMAGLFSAGTALGFMLPLYILGDIVALLRFRRRILWRPLMKALPWGIAGTVLAWYVAGEIARRYGADADDTLRTVIGVLMAVVVILNIYVGRHPEMAMSKSARLDKSTTRVRTWYGALLGSFAGFVSMITNSGGPVWAMYFSSLGLEVREVIGTSVYCFFIVTLVKIPLSAQLGFLDWHTLQFNLVLAPLTIAGVYVGTLVSGKFSKKTFASIIQVLAIAGALYMILL